MWPREEAGVFQKSWMDGLKKNSYYIHVYTSFVECQLSPLCPRFL